MIIHTVMFKFWYVLCYSDILRNYNPHLYGMSTGTGNVSSRVAGFNVAVPGAEAL